MADEINKDDLSSSENNDEKKPIKKLVNDMGASSENLIDAESTVIKIDASSVPYVPASDCFSVDTSIPISQRYEIKKALANIEKVVTNVDFFVARKLGYDPETMCRNGYFSGEQIDALALAIFNFEYKSRGMIIGDMAGVGKGRIAAGMIKYAKENGYFPIFFTVTPNLFSDIFRDLKDIGADDLVPIEIAQRDKDKNLITVKKYKTPKKEEILAVVISDINNGKYEAPFDEDLIKELYEEMDSDDEESDDNSKDKKSTQILKDVVKYYKDNGLVEKIVEYKTFMKRNDNYKKDFEKSQKIIPFIMASSAKREFAEIKDDQSNLIYELPSDNDKKRIMETGDISGYDLIVSTYSQIQGGQGFSKRLHFLSKIVQQKKIFLIFDESHKASGESITGQTAIDLIGYAQGRAVFLSATYAKRPDNMPIYASSTSISDAGLESEQLIDQFNKFGVPLQEVVSSQLVREGEYIRRQRTYDGIKINYFIMDETMHSVGFDFKEKHTVLADETTRIIYNLIQFQREYIDPVIKKKRSRARANGDYGISKAPAFSGVFNIINQMLLCIKAPEIAEYAINEMRNGKKPIIALYNTMESAVDRLERLNHPDYVGSDIVDLSFKGLLKSKIERIFYYKEKDPLTGKPIDKKLEFIELDPLASIDYQNIISMIDSMTSGTIAAPIDIIRKKIEDAGFTFYEITGRTNIVEILDDKTGVVKTRQRRPVKEVVNEFQDNILDCILINVSGSTGLSAHAVPTRKVTKIKTNKGYVNSLKELSKGEHVVVPSSMEPRDEVKQRVMIMLQPDLDINIEVQKRGRIFRTGQVLNPEYVYITSAIPAEKRLLMMLKKKNKSLDANTSSSQEDSSSLLESVDLLNKVGDIVCLKECTTGELTDIPAKIDAAKWLFTENNEGVLKPLKEPIESLMNKISSRVAILPVKDQVRFYDVLSERFIAEVQRQKAMDEYVLETNKLDYKAKFIEARLLVDGTGTGKSVFSKPLYIVKTEVNNLNKPYPAEQLAEMMSNALTIEMEDGVSTKLDAADHADYWIKKMEAWVESYRTFQLKEVEINAEAWKKEALKFINEKYSEDLEKKERNTESLEMQYRERLQKGKDYVINYVENVEKNVRTLFTNYRIGSVIDYPMSISEKGSVFRTAIIYNIKIDMREKYPFTPSKIILQLAFPVGSKSMPLPFSQMITNMSLIAKKGAMSPNDQFIETWTRWTKESSSPRIIKYIAMGNVLLIDNVKQGATLEDKNKWIKKMIEFTDFSNPNVTYKGVEISGYSFESGGTTTLRISNNVSVLKQLLSRMGTSVQTSFGSLQYDYDSNLIIYTDKGSIFNNEEIKQLVKGQTFYKYGGAMKGVVEYENVNRFIEIISETSENFVINSDDYNLFSEEIGGSVDIEQVIGTNEDDYADVISLLNADLNKYEEQRKKEEEEAENQRTIDEQNAVAATRIENKFYKLINILK